MSKINEKKVSFTPPREEDEGAKSVALQDWTDDRMKLLAWRPFIGTLAMNLELIPVVDHRCQTASTEGKRIFFKPHFLNDLTNDERMTILAHEIWHCGMSHFMREHGRIEDHEMWNRIARAGLGTNHQERWISESCKEEEDNVGCGPTTLLSAHIPPWNLTHVSEPYAIATQLFCTALDRELPGE